MKISVEAIILVGVSACGIISLTAKGELSLKANETLNNLLMAYAGYMTKIVEQKEDKQ